MTVVLSMAAATMLSGCKPEAPAPVQNTSSPQTTASPGKVIYDQQCAICHGKTGKGDTMIAASYPHANFTDATWGYGESREDLIRSTTDGIPRTPMRGFKGALSEKEIEDVVDYVLSMSGK